MEAPNIEDMIDFRRLPKDTLVLLLLLLYFPVGICLMLLRIFIGIHVFLVSCALPESFLKRFIVRVMCSVLGMHVRQKNPRSRDKNTKLFICNHVTEFDHNIINLLTPCCTPQFEGSTGFVCWARGFMEVHPAPGQEAIGEFLQRYCSMEAVSPLLLLPEEDTTNGHVGLLKFSWLPPVSRQDDESSQEFANKVQELLACELGLVSTKLTRADKAEHIKRKRHAVPPTSTRVRPASISLGFMVPTLGTDERRIAKMAQQVKDVLPHIPLNIIVKDLAKTNCVDHTITNLLENRAEASVEETGTSSFGASMNSTYSSSSAPTTKPAGKPFAKSPADRHLSLQERKEALYNFARRRYIEKHGLDQEDGH
ncbi:lipid droplet-regulating VLDL assembly factor AUP1 isoform X2 [Nerophis ophidion]|uniref:lipid droplet-regulating VLDL assembly factor AUP1 isoform X2 n=1 Tax=Nerophis ophidion TaxID=159077 RepID=UPI002ADFB03E|nr:lipid droplet-regulating VLDL assembly factor AUP1 isoform X2 [Nerophis ophidion]